MFCTFLNAAHRRRRAVGAALLAVVASTAARGGAQPLEPGMIGQAIAKASGWLVAQQRPDGSWEAARSDGNEGPTALVLLALANTGVGADDPAVRKGLDWLRSRKPDTTYAVSLQTMALAMLSPEKDRAILERNVAWLEQAQIAGQPGDPAALGERGRAVTAGSWTYGQRAGAAGDNSNSQFALLALHEAARAGVPVKRQTWQLAQRYWASCANPDGSWGYTIGTNRGSGSMTCAGIASIWITAEHLGAPAARAVADGSVQCCGGGASPRELERGIAWLGRNFSVTENPGSGGPVWLFYYLYGLERVGRFSARRYIGEADWYLEGSRLFLSLQDRLTGRFASPRLEDPLVATSFAVLFLAKGRRPVIVAKSSHERPGDWNRHGHDVAHLVDYVEGRWKKDYPAGLSWHVIDTQAAGRDDLLQAPVLWISGKDAFNLGPDAGARLRRYIDEGGFVFAEGCCPDSRGFDTRFRQLVGEIFPEPEYGLHLLPPEHPAWHAEEIVPPEFHRPLLGVDYGCRTCLIYVPPSEGAEAMPSLGCLWELGGGSRRALPPAVGLEVGAALAIGTNVLAYATNREVKRKDELFALPDAEEQPPERAERGRVAIAKLTHAGMCDAAPAALANILRAAARELGVRVDDTPAQIDPGREQLFDYHLVFMHGRQDFEFDAPRREHIAAFLDRGGTLLADAVCASGGFANAFRAEIAAILPGRALEPIPPDDPLFTAADYGGYDIRQVELREPAGGDGPLAVRKRRVPPQLEGVRLGDRWAVIFSPYDLSCALERANSMECAGYGRDDAEKIALNVLLYSLNH
ncbi:MAG: DUF4159 domain-containing protein [Planctomycetaceae bacterium]